MSCKVTVKTQVKDFNTFKEVAEEVGWTCNGSTFRKGSINFEMIKKDEIYCIRKEDYHDIGQDELMQAYATKMVISEARKRGLTVKTTGTDKAGNVKVEILL